jgi:pyrimidine operon attenuation protein/uracil phosphoribosyltransferase
MNSILNHLDIQRKITRLAHEVIENTFEESVLYIGGICGNGILIAEKLKDIIQTHSVQEIHVFEIHVNKDEPWKDDVFISIDEALLKNAYILLVDDVLNSGKTMQYALMKFLQGPTKSIKTVALVDRTHRRYPIKADFVGLSLSTTLKERVEVILNEHTSRAFLI